MSNDSSRSSRPLILVSKVVGAGVFNATGEKVGHIHDIAIGKESGHVAYAVLASGGFLGAGERHYPIPWQFLTYDPSRGAYVTALDKDQLRRAPSYDMHELGDVGDAEAERERWADHWGPFI